MNKSDYLYTYAGGFYYPLIPRKSVTNDKLYEWDGKKFVPYPKEVKDEK